jgi:MFS family permease
MAPDRPSSPPASRLARIVRSLHHRNFRLFFIGQGISVIGTWLQQSALSWLVSETTDRDGFKIALVSFASMIPSFLLVAFVGVLLERWNRHRVVIATQTLALIQAGLLAGLVLGEVIDYWHMIALSLFMGLINAFDMPGRQAFLPEMLDNKEDLGNAIALNSSLFNGARFLGPLLAGMLITMVGEGMCFLLNALSYVAVIAALMAMTIPRRVHAHHHVHVLRGLREGFAYAFGFPPVRAILLLVAMLSFVGMPYTVLMPIFAANVLQGGPETYGLLMAAAGVGALTGAIYMASRPSVLGLGTRITMASFFFGIGLIVFSQSAALWLSFGALVMVGFGMMISLAGCNTILQTIIPDDKRGRVMSMYTMCFMGISPFGSLVAGGLESGVGAPTTVLIFGIACLVGAAVFAWRLRSLRAHVRPIYIEKGIIKPAPPVEEPVPEILISAED